VWDALKKLFEGRTTLILVDLGRHLQTTHCAEEDSICKHFEWLTDLHQQLAAMGKTVPDSKYASILMGSLPPSTLSAISVAAEMSGTTPTPAIVTKLATDEYDQCTLRGGKAQDEAFATVADARRRGKKQVECFNCHKKGHVKADCWARGGGKEGQGPRRRGGGGKDGGAKGNAAAGAKQAEEKSRDIEAWAAMIGVEEEEADEVPQVPVMAADEAAGAEMELYDSGASCHMSPFHKRFVTYHKIPARPITAANNRVFYAVGVGDLQIQVPNGTSSSKVLLRDTLHAPEMGLTVVSIGRIVKASFTVQFEDRSCKIKKGGSIVGSIPASVNGLFKVEHALTASAKKPKIFIHLPKSKSLTQILT